MRPLTPELYATTAPKIDRQQYIGGVEYIAFCRYEAAKRLGGTSQDYEEIRASRSVRFGCEMLAAMVGDLPVGRVMADVDQAISSLNDRAAVRA